MPDHMKTIHKIYPLALLVCYTLWASPIKAQAPFTISLEKVTQTAMPALQSFSFGSALINGTDYWLLVGGRTAGFHGTHGAGSTFPINAANDKLIVVDIANDTQYQADIPAEFLIHLRSTNMNFFQDGDILYCIGGYGCTTTPESDGCYETFPFLTAIDVPKTIQAIIDGTDPSGFISQITDERLRVTGGDLDKLGEYFVLSVGHNYQEIYTTAHTGAYTQHVARFMINYTDSQLSISEYDTYTVDEEYEDTNELHRRDLPAAPVVMPSGKLGIGLYGGVFTSRGLGFVHPIYGTLKASGNIRLKVEDGYSQETNNYECAHVLMYDPTAENMYTTFLGGIGACYLDDQGQVVCGDASQILPFNRAILTLTLNSNGTSGTPQSEVLMPSYLGSNAVFHPLHDLPRYERCEEILDYSQLPSGNKVLLGYMMGGILSNTPQSGPNPTYASDRVYEVYLNR